MTRTEREIVLARALRRALGPCKHCGKHADNLNIQLEDDDLGPGVLAARCLSCGRNNLPERVPEWAKGDPDAA